MGRDRKWGKGVVAPPREKSLYGRFERFLVLPKIAPAAPPPRRGSPAAQTARRGRPLARHHGESGRRHRSDYCQCAARATVRPVPNAAATVADQPAAERGAPLVALRIHALRPGTWPAAPADLSVDAAQIAATAGAYDPQRYHAPVVIGHPDNDDPAWGWVDAASADERGLWLDVRLLPEMAQLVRAHRYRAVSVSLWTPAAAGNPAPGVWSLKHLGFLGAVPPAVKGLDPVRLAAADAAACITTLSDMEETAMTEQVDTARLAEREQQLAERDRTLAERDRTISERERRLDEREQQLRRQGFERDLDAHVGAGRVLAADRPGLVALMERLADAPAVTLADAGEQPALELLRGFIARLPARVDLSERAAGAGAGAAAGAAFAAPGGATVEPERLAVHQRALAHQSAHPGMPYAAAVAAVMTRHA